MRGESARGWIEVLANIGVFIGIIFLVYEIKQDNLSRRTEAVMALSERFAELDGSVADSLELADLLVRADQQNEELTPAEFRRYVGHYDRWMNILFRAEGLYIDGTLTEADWLSYMCEVRSFYLGSQKFREFVETAKARYLTDGIYKGISQPELCGR